MANDTNTAPDYVLEAGGQEAVVAKPLSELPMIQRTKITSELQRIHKMVSALDQDMQQASREKGTDKAN